MALKVTYRTTIEKLKKLIPFRRVVASGALIPPFYGVAVRDWNRQERICYPLGINLIVILLIDMRYWLKDPKGS